MVFTQQLSIVDPLNAFNENVVKFTEATAVETLITITVTGFDVMYFTITPIDSEFYFNLKEVFKFIINQNLFGDDYEYTAVEVDEDLFKSCSVKYTTHQNLGGDIIDEQTFTYLVLKSVVQIEYIQTDLSYLHLKTDEVLFDVFSGYPFSISYLQRPVEPIVLPMSFFTDGHDTIYSDIPSIDNYVVRIPIIDYNGDLMNYGGVNQLVLFENIITGLQIIKTDGVNNSYIHFHEECDGTYLKWLNQFGGWDYWLFGDKHKVTEKDKSLGVIFSGHDNIENITSIESSLGKAIEKVKSLKADFLDSYRFSKLSKIIYSPKVYLWTGTKFVEVMISGSNEFIANRQEGLIEFDLIMPKRIMQTI